MDGTKKVNDFRSEEFELRVERRESFKLYEVHAADYIALLLQAPATFESALMTSIDLLDILPAQAPVELVQLVYFYLCVLNGRKCS